MASTTPAAALARQLTVFSRELRSATRGAVRGVHQARVASRRLREGLRASETVLPTGVGARGRRALRDLSRTLGAVRECDVTLALAAVEAERHEWSTVAMAMVTDALQAERRRRHTRLRRAAAGNRWRRALRGVRRGLAAADGRAWGRAAGVVARESRHRRALALGQALAQVGTLYVPDQLHAVRLATKKLRYALEWEEQAGRRGWVRERQVLEAAQDQLGEWHDRLILLEWLHRLRRTGDHPRVVVADFKHMAAQLERECRTRHAAILAMVPALSRVAKAAAR